MASAEIKAGDEAALNELDIMSFEYVPALDLVTGLQGGPNALNTPAFPLCHLWRRHLLPLMCRDADMTMISCSSDWGTEKEQRSPTTWSSRAAVTTTGRSRRLVHQQPYLPESDEIASM